MYELTHLTAAQIHLCEDTISTNTFYMLVGSALLSGRDLSVVRMGDGEVRLYQDVKDGGDEPVLPTKRHDRTWLQKLGLLGIPKGLLRDRMESAAREATHFAPSISGIWRSDYDNYGLSHRARYVDNFFVNSWTPSMITALFRAAGHVLLIHASAETADSMQINSQDKLGVKVSYLKLTSWEQSEGVIEAAHRIDAPLVLFSAGPGAKYIGPAISNGHGKVALDLGNSVDGWTLSTI
jgi:hypothetical protein